MNVIECRDRSRILRGVRSSVYVREGGCFDLGRRCWCSWVFRKLCLYWFREVFSVVVRSIGWEKVRFKSGIIRVFCDLVCVS